MSDKNDPASASLKIRRTKIIATLGPVSSSYKKIEKLIRGGVSLFRINMSHGVHEEHAKVVKRIRKAAQQLDRHIGILMDLCGPKIRVGRFAEGEIMLLQNDEVIVSCEDVLGTDGLIPSQYPNLCRDMKTGERIFLDDGQLELKVREIRGNDLVCKVVFGGVLKDHKGMNLPDSDVSAESFTEKDQRDAELAIALGADFLALSFVRDSDEIINLKQFLHERNADIPIIAKIEKLEAVNNIDKILSEAYGIMVARGDLGVELPAQKVPLIQKDLIDRARCFNKPVIVATQMLESMTAHSRPTRAEVGDVANAALSSADAVMLSAETASGKHPIKSVQMMDSVLREMECYMWERGSFGDRIEGCESSQLIHRRAVAHAVSSLAKELKLRAIVVPTEQGTTARVLAADRPLAPLLGVSPDVRICRRLSLHWGVLPFDYENRVDGDWKLMCRSIAPRCELSKHSEGDVVLLVAGFNDDPVLNEPVMKVLNV